MSNRRVDGDFGVCGPASLLVDGCLSLGTDSMLACDGDASFKFAKLTLRVGVDSVSDGSGCKCNAGADRSPDGGWASVEYPLVLERGGVLGIRLPPGKF